MPTNDCVTYSSTNDIKKKTLSLVVLSRIAPKVDEYLYLLHNLDSDVGVVRPKYFSDTVGFVPKRNVSEYRSNSLASTRVAPSTQSAVTNFSTYYRHSSANRKCG